MKYALPIALLATPAIAHHGALHSHASLADWLGLAAVLAALAAPALIVATVKARKRK